VSTGQTILLGAIAGLTIFLGLPVGRMRTGSSRVRTLLNGLSAGILVFLLVEILAESTHVVEESLEHLAGGGSAARFAGLVAVFVLGLGVGLMGLLYAMLAWRRREARSRPSVGPGAMALAEAAPVHGEALRLGLSIAVGIGLHNFSEGLAIGQTAQAGDVSLALLLITGFALHNATEGFGIVGPLAASGVRPSWGWLLLAGVIGGGPTFLGTVVGSAVASAYVYVAFLALAGGAILYVVGELFAAGRRLSWEWTMWGVLLGFLAGFGTELILELA
jgi:ZIP family zinc transporter